MEGKTLPIKSGHHWPVNKSTIDRYVIRAGVSNDLKGEIDLYSYTGYTNEVYYFQPEKAHYFP